MPISLTRCRRVAHPIAAAMAKFRSLLADFEHCLHHHRRLQVIAVVGLLHVAFDELRGPTHSYAVPLPDRSCCSSIVELSRVSLGIFFTPGFDDIFLQMPCYVVGLVEWSPLRILTLELVVGSSLLW
jgi:hypothetical protein